ncbi:MAG TPA: N-acetylglucosaminyltransferase, partial [Ruminococcaceae bacterium]|nr:N-acetylglucosaminyltransferase [Oscillospiraceae bacterium]
MAEIASWYGGLKTVYAVIGAVLSAMLIYKTAYKIIGLFFTRKFPSAKQKHKYAVVIAARNEEKVIGNLLDSIAKQDYPKELITVFVVADNCTDKTAEVARNRGAVCYERFDNEHKTKGFALQFLFDRIEED